MKQKRIVVHARRVSEGVATAVAEEMSHASVHGKADVRAAHIFYNGDDHYDALVGLADLAGMEPAWPQPSVPVYVVAAEVQPCSTSKNSTRRAVKKHTLKKKTRPSAKQPKPKQKPTRADARDKPPQSADGSAEAPPLTQPQSVSDGDAEPGLMEALEAIPAASFSGQPHRELEDLIRASASQKSMNCYVEALDYNCDEKCLRACLLGFGFFMRALLPKVYVIICKSLWLALCLSVLVGPGGQAVARPPHHTPWSIARQCRRWGPIAERILCVPRLRVGRAERGRNYAGTAPQRSALVRAATAV